MPAFITKRLHRRHFSRITAYEKDVFDARYKGCEISIYLMPGGKDRWGIDVRGRDGGYLVDAVFTGDTIEDALKYAIEGACL